VLFDPATIVDRGSFEDPHQTPAGIAAVFVNGVRVVAEEAVDRRASRPPLRRRGS
jgi:hypothetical protein